MPDIEYPRYLESDPISTERAKPINLRVTARRALILPICGFKGPQHWAHYPEPYFASRGIRCGSNFSKVSLPSLDKQGALGSLTDAQADRALGRTAASRFDVSVLPLIPSHSGDLSELQGYLRGPRQNIIKDDSSLEFNKSMALARMRETHFALRTNPNARPSPTSPGHPLQAPTISRSWSTPNLNELSKATDTGSSIPPVPTSPLSTASSATTTRGRSRRLGTPKNKKRSEEEGDDSVSLSGSARRSRRSPSLSFSSMRKTFDRLRTSSETPPPVPSPTSRGKGKPRPGPVRTTTDPSVTPTRSFASFGFSRKNFSNSSLSGLPATLSDPDLANVGNQSSSSLPLPQKSRRDFIPNSAGDTPMYGNETVQSPSSYAISEADSVSLRLLSQRRRSSILSSGQNSMRSPSARGQARSGSRPTSPGLPPAPASSRRAPDEREGVVPLGMAVSDVFGISDFNGTDQADSSSKSVHRSSAYHLPHRLSGVRGVNMSRTPTNADSSLNSSDSISEYIIQSESPSVDMRNQNVSPLSRSPVLNSLKRSPDLDHNATPRMGETIHAPLAHEETFPTRDEKSVASAEQSDPVANLAASEPVDPQRTPAALRANSETPRVTEAPAFAPEKTGAQGLPDSKSEHKASPAMSASDQQDKLIVQIEDAFQQIMNIAVKSQAVNVPLARPRPTQKVEDASATMPRRIKHASTASDEQPHLRQHGHELQQVAESNEPQLASERERQDELEVEPMPESEPERRDESELGPRPMQDSEQQVGATAMEPPQESESKPGPELEMVQEPVRSLREDEDNENLHAPIAALEQPSKEPNLYGLGVQYGPSENVDAFMPKASSSAFPMEPSLPRSDDKDERSQALGTEQLVQAPPERANRSAFDSVQAVVADEPKRDEHSSALGLPVEEPQLTDERAEAQEPTTERDLSRKLDRDTGTRSPSVLRTEEVTAEVQAGGDPHGSPQVSLARLFRNLSDAASQAKKAQSRMTFHSQLEEFAAQQANLRGTIESSRAEIMELRRNIRQFCADLREDSVSSPAVGTASASSTAAGLHSAPQEQVSTNLASMDYLDRRLKHLLDQSHGA